jgi:hypothetical protein
VVKLNYPAARHHLGHVADGPAQIGRVVEHAAEGVVLDADVAAQVEDAAHAVVERAAEPEQARVVVEGDLVAVEGVCRGVVVSDGFRRRRAGFGGSEAVEGTHEEILFAVVQELAPVRSFANRQRQQGRQHGTSSPTMDATPIVHFET